MKFLVPHFGSGIDRSEANGLARAAQVHTAPMQEIHTHIDIEAPASIVWGILSDFGMYRRWNPLIRGVLGHAGGGRQLEISLAAPPGADVAARLTIVHFREDREMTWLEWWTVPGLFASERRFRIDSLPHGGVRFHHDEQVRGIMVPLLVRRRRSRERAGFEAMNTALKLRAERARARQAPATN